MINEIVSKHHQRPWISTRDFARRLRAQETPAEKFLWRFLCGRQRLGFQFRRQQAIHHWIVDFYCPQAQVAIEVDGSWHDLRKEADLLRDRNLDRFGILVLRLTNDLVLRNIDSALGQIEWALTAHRLGKRTRRIRGRRIHSRISIRRERANMRAVRVGNQGRQLHLVTRAEADTGVTERRAQTLSSSSRLVTHEPAEVGAGFIGSAANVPNSD